jgi:methyl-accepting chemotaxis protein
MAKIGAAFVLGLFVAGPFAAALKLEAEKALEVTSRLTPLEAYTQQTKDIILELEKANQTLRGNLTQLPGLSGLLDNLIDTLLQPVQDAVNNSFTNLNDTVSDLLPLVVQKKEQLLASAHQGWDSFVVKVNSTFWDTEDLWGQIPWQMITSALDNVGASAQVPPAMTDALDVLTAVTQSLADIREFGPIMLQSTANEAQDIVSQYIQPYLDRLLQLLTVVQLNKEKLKTAFGKLVTNIDNWLHHVPGHQFVPESVFENVNTMLQGLQSVVDNVADTAYSAVDELVTGLQEALDIVLGREGVTIATGPSGAPRAARLGGLLTTATLVLAFKGLP